MSASTPAATWPLPWSRWGRCYCIRLLGERHALDLVALLQSVHGIEAVGHLAEHGVIVVEVRLRLQHQEELRAAGVAAAVRHRQRALQVPVRIALQLAGDLPARPAAAGAVRAAALRDEARDDAVELQAVVESVLGQRVEIGDG